MAVANHFRDYSSEDYLASPWARDGCWDEPSQLMLIVPEVEAGERTELEFLVVGRPGVDGIEFGYRKGKRGLWAYYPIDREFVFMAPTLVELVEGWLSGKLSV